MPCKAHLYLSAKHAHAESVQRLTRNGSLIKILKRNGPKTDPCDTPAFFCFCEQLYIVTDYSLQGTNPTRNFQDWSMKTFQAEAEAREFLKKYGIEHYWDIALSQSLLEENEEGMN